MSERVDLLTPVCRLVQGDPFKPQTKDATGRPLVTLDGQPKVKYYIGVAIRKDDPDWPALWQQIQAVAVAAWPNREYEGPNFAWKYTDGDTKPDRDGFAGCHILNLSSSYAPTVFTKGGVEEVPAMQSQLLRRGYYIRVAFSVAGNKSTQTPGIYLNPNAVEIYGEGPEINVGPDGATLFGTPAATTPPGMGAAPAAPAPAAPAAPAAPPAPGAPPAAPAPAGPPAGLQPAPGFVPATPGPQAPGAPAAPPAPTAPAPTQAPPPPAAPAPPAPAAGPQLTPTAVASGYTVESLQAAGYSIEQMRQAGYIV